MEITCEHCAATLNIPDDKIPKSQVFRISCPKCKSKKVTQKIAGFQTITSKKS